MRVAQNLLFRYVRGGGRWQGRGGGGLGGMGRVGGGGVQGELF